MKHPLKSRRDGTRSKAAKLRTRQYRQARRIKYTQLKEVKHAD